MKLILSYLKYRRGAICAYILAQALCFWALKLSDLPTRAILYALFLSAALELVYLIYDFCVQRKTHLSFPLDDGEAFKPRGIIENDLALRCKALKDEKNALSKNLDARGRKTEEYFTIWAHEIKTPLSSLSLRAQADDSRPGREMLSDIHRTERYVDMAMTYLKLEGEGTDYVFKEYSVDEVLRPVLRGFAGEFILRGLKLEYTPSDDRVLTDKKWLGFICEQLISNALKYTRRGSVSVYFENNRLHIKDTGIGIPPEDMPRIFDRGYTGLTGREQRNASGLGLYLCRRVCDELGHKIYAESVPNEGSRFTVEFSGDKISQD